MPRRAVLVLALAAGASRAAAGEIHVPGDYPNLKTATREASAGDVILVDTSPLGGTFTLSFDVPGRFAVLFFSSGVAAPLLLPGAGYSYLVAPLLVGPVGTGAPQILSFPVPAAAALLGLEGGFQIFDLTLGLTAPAVGVLGP
jgi:hypothetical protein